MQSTPNMELDKLTQEIFSKLEQKWLFDCQSPKCWKKTRILSIDGGGAKPLVASHALIHLEDLLRSKSGNPDVRIVDFFDVLAGTGVGGILAVMLAADDGNGRPLYTAREAVQHLRSLQKEMFRPAGGRFFGRQRRFSGRSLERVLREVLKAEDGRDLTLRDTCRPLLVPIYDLNSSAPFVFSRADAAETPSFDFDLWKVCRATSATPSLFRPFRLESEDGKTTCVAIDGGLVMNNPSAAAITHVLHNKRDFPSIHGVEDLMVLSLGNGPLGSGRRGPSRWSCSGRCSTPEMVEIVLDGVSETVDQMLGNAFFWNRMDYVRIQSNGLLGQPSTIDVAADSEEAMARAGAKMLTEKAVESLPFGGKRLLPQTNGERMEKFVERLIAAAKGMPPSPSKDGSASPLSRCR